MKNQESKRSQSPMHDQRTLHDSDLSNSNFDSQPEAEQAPSPTANHQFSQIRVSDEQKQTSANEPSSELPTILRLGQDLPGLAQLENVDASSDAVIAVVQQAAMNAHSRFGSNVNWDNRVGGAIRMAIGGGLAQRTIPISFVEERGLNAVWTGSINFKMDGSRPIDGGGTGAVERNTGGTGSIGGSSQTSSTDSAQVSGQATSTPGPSGGAGGNVGVQAGTSTSRQDGSSFGSTVASGGKSTADSNLERFQAALVVDVNLTYTPDMSGTDYINPFKWGMSLGDAVSGPFDGHASGAVGSIQYFRSNGLTARPPTQRRSWIEHELGITDEDARNAKRMNELNALNPADFSRSGAQALPAGVTQAAQAQYGASLDGVNLIHGGQADSYAQQMDAAAFTTPNAQGGSDIFVRGSVDLDSAVGQHTLQHEIAHAAQNKNGQTDQLSGLGGDPFQRHTLERDADQKADGVMKSVTQNAPTAAEAKPAQGA